MKTNHRWREFGMVAMIAVGFGAADAWSHRTPATCPACEFEALRTTTTDGTVDPGHENPKKIRESLGR